MKNRILILANSASGLYDFRNELLLEMLQENEVHVSLPDEERVPELGEEGCILHHAALDRRSVNPVKDLKLLRFYGKLIKEVKPDVVLTYTIKPNIYGGLCCRFRKTPYITSITGLGSAFEKNGVLQKIVVCLYRVALKRASCVFFQNGHNAQVFERLKIRGKKARLVPGSGVNLDRHCFEEYPCKEEPVKFLYVGRIMKEKGIDELLYAARRLKKEHSDVVFELVGKYEDDYRDVIAPYVQEGVVRMVAYQKDMHPYYKSAWAVLMPSYHEGMSNVILEAAATGRPVIASDIPGCQEGFDEGRTGFGVKAGEEESLYQTLARFMELSYEEKAAMGNAARQKMEAEFDRKRVVDAYVGEIKASLGGNTKI